MPGLDPASILFAKRFYEKSMDCRVKPGNDCGWGSGGDNGLKWSA
jgi:hypothetical protein